LLSSAQKQFATALASVMPETDPCLDEDPVLTLTYEHDDVLAGAHRLADGRLGSWMQARLPTDRPPRVVGVSVMYSGQVLVALALSVVARRTWPRALIVWGGAHVTALRHEIVADARYGECVDRFVFGYAERTWVDVLDAVE